MSKSDPHGPTGSVIRTLLGHKYEVTLSPSARMALCWPAAGAMGRCASGILTRGITFTRLRLTNTSSARLLRSLLMAGRLRAAQVMMPDYGTLARGVTSDCSRATLLIWIQMVSRP